MYNIIVRERQIVIWKDDLRMNLEELKKDCSKKQKKGIHFIIASVVIWTMVLIVQLTNLPILTKNYYLSLSYNYIIH